MFTEWLAESGDSFIDEFFEDKYEKKGKRGIGSDGISYEHFLKNYDREKRTILRQLTNGKYSFSPFLKTNIHEMKFKAAQGEWVSKPRGIIQAGIKDTIAQSLILEYLVQRPPYTDFYAHSYAYQSGKSPIQAVRAAHHFLKLGYQWVYDADISKFFDSIDHTLLLDLIGCHYSGDQALRKLFERFIKAGYIDVPSFKNYLSNRTGGKIRAICDRKPEGIPQGGILSGFLANLFLHSFDLTISKDTNLDVKYVRYADDFIILAKSHEDILKIKRLVEEDLLPSFKLSISPEKTFICHERSGFHDRTGFEFLGFKFMNGVISVKEANMQKFIRSISTIHVARYDDGERFFETFRVTPHKIKKLGEGPRVNYGVMMTESDWDSLERCPRYLEELDILLSSDSNAEEAWRKYSWYDYFYLATDLKQIKYLDAAIRSRLERLYTVTHGKRPPQDYLKNRQFKSFTNRFFRTVKLKVLQRKENALFKEKMPR